MTTNICNKCDGKGEIPCPACNGAKSQDNAAETTKGFSWEPCACCNGTGKIECPKCNGTGKSD